MSSAAAASRWKRVKPEEQVSLKRTEFHRFLQIPIRGCDDARIDMMGLGSTNPFKFMFLEGPGSNLLCVSREFSNLV
ncbi:MAG: hypothetical protein R3B95_06730 [Nitrospirales bacterium]|nr:hypothetical protein [Nitrospirales bacterium]